MAAVIVILMVAGFAVLAVALVSVLYIQGQRKPKGTPHYVALGSSFAAGIGLGKRAPGSPYVCMRSINGYPQQLSRMLALPLVDVSCSGATTTHVLRGGQAFLPAQLDALRADTTLVTLTIGGNDVRYVGDLSLLAIRRRPTWLGWMLRRFWRGPLSPAQRDFEHVRKSLTSILQHVRHRSPKARIVVVTYPTILPPLGTCAKLNITGDEAAAMRQVGDRLADLTCMVAREHGALVVDMNRLGADNHACAAIPWVNGVLEAAGTAYHPTYEGALATAWAIADVLGVPDNETSG